MYSFSSLFGRETKEQPSVQKEAIRKISNAIEIKADEKGNVQLENIKKELTTAVTIIKSKMIIDNYIQKFGIDLNKLLKKYRLPPIFGVSPEVTPNTFFPLEMTTASEPRKQIMLKTFEQCFPFYYSSLHQPKKPLELELEALFTELDNNLPPFSELIRDSGSGITSSYYFSFESFDIVQNVLDSSVEELIADKSKKINDAFKLLYAWVYSNTLQKENLTSRKPEEQRELASLLGAIYDRKVDSARSSLQELTTTLLNNWSSEAAATVLTESDREKAKTLLTSSLSLNATSYDGEDHFLLVGATTPHSRPVTPSA